MYRNYLKIALRHLQKNKLFTFIKLTGLTAGVLGCLLIGLYLQHELSYDSMHEKADRIVRTTMEFSAGGEVVQSPNTGNLVAPTLQAEFPEVVKATRVIKYDNVPVKYFDKQFDEQDYFYADSTFFSIFSFELLAGDPATALTAPRQLVLSESMARKYFDAENPLGKTIQVYNTEYLVSGVMADPPANTQIQPRFIASFVSHRDAAPERATWWSANYATYLLLQDPGDRKKLETKITPFMKTRTGETGMEGEDYLTYHFEPLRDVHLRSSVEGNFEPNGDIRYIYLLSTVGLLILLIGITTYVNLTTAGSMERSREIGVQKVLGAGRIQLLQQHLGEAGMLTLAAMVSGLALFAPLLPFFNELLEKELEAGTIFQPVWLLGLVLTGLLITLLSGSYPAWVSAKFKPIDTLKAGPAAARVSGGNRIRKALVVFQFAISVFLLIGTLVIQGQMNFIREKNLGYDKDHVLVLPTDQNIVNKVDAFRSELLQNNQVESISLAYETPTYIEGGYGISKSVTGEGDKPVIALPADDHFLPAMSIELAAGSNLTRNHLDEVRRMQDGDTTVVRSILINEKQATAYGWKATEAVGKQVNFNGRVAQIAGVVQNFHFASLHQPVGNLVIFPDTWGNALLVKISGNDIPATLSFLERKWESLAPHRPFSYHFLDEEFDALYGAEHRSARLVTAGCLLAIFLACLGLLGLATYSIVQRTKEIGVRKVLGATTTGIVGLLSKDFLKLVAIGFIIAAPFAWYVMDNWLQDFSYRIDIGWWIFALAGLISLAIAFLTVSVQSVRAAMANPVEALRSE